MKKLSCFLVAWLAVGVLLGGAATASALEITDRLREQLKEEISLVEPEGNKISNMMVAMRDAGASYLPEIPAPADADKYQDSEQRRMIVGVYFMDLTYAATFEQALPCIKYGEAINRLLEQMGFPQPEMERRYREALEKVDEPEGLKLLEEILEQEDQDTSWQEMIRTVDGMDLIMGGMYGFLVEGLYITGEMSVLSNYDPKFIIFVNHMRNTFMIFRRALLLFENEPELAKLVELDERLQFITDVLKTLGDLPEIGPDQIDALRPMITKARNEIVQ